MADVNLNATIDGSGIFKGPGVKRVVLSPERQQQDDWRRLAQEAGEMVVRCIQTGMKLPAGAPDMPYEELIKFGGEIGNIMRIAYEIGYTDAEKSRKPKEV